MRQATIRLHTYEIKLPRGSGVLVGHPKSGVRILAPAKGLLQDITCTSSENLLSNGLCAVFQYTTQAAQRKHAPNHKTLTQTMDNFGMPPHADYVDAQLLHATQKGRACLTGLRSSPLKLVGKAHL